MVIKFGTDGWRAIIAEDFTFANVRACAQGVASYLKETGLAQRGLVVGYDTRFASEEFAASVAEVMAGNGIKTYLASRHAPTPVVSYGVIERGAAGAVVITASHNPAQWNGFKYRPEYAGSAPQEVVEALERHIADDSARGVLCRMALEEARQQGLVESFDLAPPYFRHLQRLLDMDPLRNAGLRVVADYMHGAGGGYFNVLLEGGSTQVYPLRGERNPLFPGMLQPEPIAHNLEDLSDEVVHRGAAVGLALDGDGDRLGVVDETGRFLTTHQVFALLAWYLLEVRGHRGPLVKSITMTSMIERLGEVYGVPVHETPVGFKYLGPVMMAQDALAAGEESGGYAFRGHIPERDGVLSGLYLLDFMVRTGKSLSQLVEELHARVGHHLFQRQDLPFQPDQREAIQSRVDQASPDALASIPVTSRDTPDGTRFRLEDGSWALIRFSGTEPLLRVYAEAPSQEQAEAIIAAVREIAGV